FFDGGNLVVDAGKAAVPAFEDEALSCCVDPGRFRPAFALRIADVEDEILVGAHAENGGHPVGRISAKVLLDALSRVICLILVEIDDIPEMDVEVHQTGDHVLPCKVRRLDIVGYSQLSDRANPDNAPVFDQHAGVLDGWRTGSIDEREIRIGLDVLARRAGACSIAASNRKRRNYTQPPAISHHSPS